MRLVYTAILGKLAKHSITVNKRLRQSSIGQQFAVLTAGLCLLVRLALIALGAISTSHMQSLLREEYGAALARLVAARVSTALESGDLLSVSASLRRIINNSSADVIAVNDIEGKVLGLAGASQGRYLHEYSEPVRIESDIAGHVIITISADNDRAAQQRLVISMLGLAVLLSLAVYGVGRHFGQRLGGRLSALAHRVALDEDTGMPLPNNELSLLQKRIDALPMDLLQARSEPGPQEENYQVTAVLYLQLTSLANYVDTLDEHSLHAYIARIHQIVYAASGFYAGDLQVARQFGLAVYFSGHNSAGSAAFRASSCAWLIKTVCQSMEKDMTLSLSLSMAISQSELGAGGGDDIYPGLYTQHTLDELQSVCASMPPNILLAPTVAEDTDISTRLECRPTEVMDYAVIEEFAGQYQDLLERQLRLVLKRLTDPGAR